MYHTWTREPIWPSPVAPPPPFPDTGYRVIAELSGTWEGGTVPGLYDEVSWQLSREIVIPDTAWLHLPYLVGETVLFAEGRLWSAGEKSAWVPLIGPGKVRITLKGHGRGGIIGGVYLVGRKGAVAWPMDTIQSPHRPAELDTISAQPIAFGPYSSFWQKGMDKPTWPVWLWALSMLLWGAAALVSYPIREAHGSGPWASTPPHPLENVLGFGIVVFFIFIIFGWTSYATFLWISLVIESLFATWLKLPFEKVWQSWMPVLGAAWILVHGLSQEWVGWGAWIARTFMFSFYMPRLAYLCTGNLFLYILIFT